MDEISEATKRTVSDILDYLHEKAFMASEEEWHEFYEYIEAKIDADAKLLAEGREIVEDLRNGSPYIEGKGYADELADEWLKKVK